MSKLKEKMALTYTFNDIVTVDTGSWTRNTLKRIAPQTGILKNTTIYRAFPDGSISKTTWDGKLNVKAGDKVVLDFCTGRVQKAKR